MSEAVATPPAPPTTGSSMPPSGGEISVAGMTSRLAAMPAGNVPAEKIEAAAPRRSSPGAEAVRIPVPGETGPKKVFDDGRKPSEKLFENLGKLVDKQDPRDVARKEAAEKMAADKIIADKKAAAPSGEQDDDFGEDPDLAGNPPAAAAEKVAAAPANGEKKKINPWHELKATKSTLAQKDAEIADLKKLVANPETRAAEVARLQALEKRSQELEEQIKFVDYSKSAEFQEKYEKPYKDAWERSMAELSELQINDPTTGPRQMEPSDLLDLVNMNLNDALLYAKETYGDAAQIVMARRKEVKDLFNIQQKALTEAKKSGVEKSQVDQTKHQAQVEQIQKEAHTRWESENARILANETTGKYFKPVDGDEKINKSMEKGYKFVDDTMALNPMNPKLTPEQREDAVKRHAALRHKAATWGRMRIELETTNRKYQEALKKLAEYEDSAPGTGGDPAPEAGNRSAPGNRMDSMMDRLGRLVKPG